MSLSIKSKFVVDAGSVAWIESQFYYDLFASYNTAEDCKIKIGLLLMHGYCHKLSNCWHQVEIMQVTTASFRLIIT